MNIISDTTAAASHNKHAIILLRMSLQTERPRFMAIQHIPTPCMSSSRPRHLNRVSALSSSYSPHSQGSVRSECLHPQITAQVLIGSGCGISSFSPKPRPSACRLPLRSTVSQESHASHAWVLYGKNCAVNPALWTFECVFMPLRFSCPERQAAMQMIELVLRLALVVGAAAGACSAIGTDYFVIHTLGAQAIRNSYRVPNSL